MLENLSDDWVFSKNSSKTSDGSWNPYDVVGHYIHGEKTDWIPRARIILEQSESVRFESFDRFAQFENSAGKSLSGLLDEFDSLRRENIKTLRDFEIVEDQLSLEGHHPELGKVTLKQLLATWAVHDLTHIRQIAIVLAKQYEQNVGVWKEYLSILK